MSAVGIWEAAIDKYHRFLTGLILENNNEEKIAHYLLWLLYSDAGNDDGGGNDNDAGNDDDGGDDADALPASPDTLELYLCAFKC